MGCIQGYTEIVKILIEHSADLNKASKNGWTALHRAHQDNHHDITTYLQNCLDYFTQGNITQGQDPNLVPGDAAYAAIAIRKQDMEAMRTIIPTISNFNFNHFIKLTERENILESNRELCHLKVKVTGKKHDSQSGREAGRQQGMLTILKQRSQTCDIKANFVKNI